MHRSCRGTHGVKARIITVRLLFMAAIKQILPETVKNGCFDSENILFRSRNGPRRLLRDVRWE